MGQTCPALHGAPSPHGMGSPISSIAGPQLKSGVLWSYANTQNGPAHQGNVFSQDCVNAPLISKALQIVTHIQLANEAQFGRNQQKEEECRSH